MVNLFSALQNTITDVNIKFKEVTGTILDEGEETERHALDIVQRDADNNIVGGNSFPTGDDKLLLDKTITDALTPSDVIMQSAATSNGNGTTINVEGYEEMRLSISGANVTTSTITFQGLDSNGNINNIGLCVRESDAIMASSTTTPAPTAPSCEVWIIPLRNVVGFRAVLSNLTGTNKSVNVIGRMS